MFLGILVGLFFYGIVGMVIYNRADVSPENQNALNWMGTFSIFCIFIGFFGTIGWILEVCL